MDRESFEAERSAICASAPPSSGDDLLGMEIDFCAFLGDPAYADDDGPGVWRDMSVSRAEGAEWLISGQAEGRSQDAEEIASALVRIWEERLRYGYRDAHTIVRTPDEVVLLGVTQIGPQGFWVTAEIRVRLSAK